jgi:hypothetical protein
MLRKIMRGTRAEYWPPSSFWNLLLLLHDGLFARARQENKP